MRIASSTDQPPLASTLILVPAGMTSATAENISRSAAIPAGEPSLILNARRSPSSSHNRTRRWAASGLEIPIVTEVTGARWGSRPQRRQTGVPVVRPCQSHQAWSTALRTADGIFAASNAASMPSRSATS